MTIPDPPWKQKTRPCPFYSQGRCLFSDSCNFLHDVKIKVKQPDIAIRSPTPDVTISFTQSSPVATSTPPSARLNVRSPPRSPRLSSLLLALSDVIGPVEDDEPLEDIEDVVQFEEPTPAVSSPRLCASPQKAEKDTLGESAAESPHDGDSPHATLDSGISEESELDYIAGTAQTSAKPSEPQELPETAGLLSPLEMKLAPPLNLPLGQLEGPIHREDSVDSGYADGWTGPSPLSLSPPRRENARRYSTLSLISSPFGSPARALSPKFTPAVGSAWPASPLFSPAKSKSSSRPTSLNLSQTPDDLDSPTDYQRNQTVDSPVDAGIGVDEETTIRRQITDPTAASPESVGPPEVPPEPATVVPEKKQLHISIPAGSASVNSRKPLSLEKEEVAVKGELASSFAAQVADNPDEADSSALYDSYYTKTTYIASSHYAELLSGTPPSSMSSSAYPAQSVLSSSSAGPGVAQISPLPEFIAGSSRDVTSPKPSTAQVSRPPSSPTSSIRSPYSPVTQPTRPPSAISRQSSNSDILGRTSSQSRTSNKVPFGFRHTAAARSRESLASRPGSAPPTRHRPSGLIGSISVRSNSLNDYQPVSKAEDPAVSSGRLRPLRLSILVNSSSSAISSGPSVPAAATAPSYTDTSHPVSPSVLSDYSLSNNPLLSSTQSEIIPSSIDHTTPSPGTQSLDGAYQTQSLPNSASFGNHATRKHSTSVSGLQSITYHRFSHIARSSSQSPRLAVEDTIHEGDEGPNDLERTVVIRGAEITSAPPFSRPPTLSHAIHEPFHAIATPRPTLLFAIASDNVSEVRRVLESGEAAPNDDVGPQSALAFTLTSNQLKHKADIVKLLLAHGADPSSIKNIVGPAVPSVDSSSSLGDDGSAWHGSRSILDAVDPATRYYISRAEAPQTRRTSALIHRSFFRPLTKVRYEMIGQDRALEQLFRVLSMPTMAPIVVLLCGPSGHGKSLLARRFGSLLDVPTHTVNMTTLRSTHDIWRSYSMSPYEEPSACTLSDFLLENEGKRCVVVLDEIEKTESDQALSSLLMPWELGRCSFEAGHRHVNVSKVVWLGTSNIGHDLVFEHQSARESPEAPMTREEYVDLMAILRPKVSARLGPSLLSRVTTVLPFVPFSTDEKLAIATEALHVLTQDADSELPAATVDKVVHDSLQSYVPEEGARSLHRAVSTQLLETM